MNAAFSSASLAWLLTYAIHSSVLLGAVWLMTRSRRVPPIASDVLWKVALVGGMVTASVQQRLDVRPAGMITLASARTAAPSVASANGAIRIEGSGLDARLRSATEAKSQIPGVQAESQPDLSPGVDAGVATRFSATTIAVMVWGAIALLLALIYAGRRLVLVGRLGDRKPVRDGALLLMLDALQRQVGHQRPVRLTSADSISSPVALGANEICVPLLAISDLDCDQQRSMLAHELAHLARHDPFWLDAASLLERVFFFQPLNRLARRELETAAEYLCDEWAMRKTGSGLHLARCLAKVAEWIQASPLGVPVAGMAEKRSLLVSRIARLLDGRVTGSPGTKRGAVVTAVMLLAGMVAVAPRVAGRGLEPQRAIIDTTDLVRRPDRPRVDGPTGAIRAIRAAGAISVVDPAIGAGSARPHVSPVGGFHRCHRADCAPQG